MNEGMISVRYGKALFELASEENVLEAVLKDIELIFSLIKEVEDVPFLLSTPLLKPSVKQKIFNTLFKDNVQPLTLNFLMLLVDKKRENYLERICRNFIDRYKTAKGIKVAVITTAFTLTESLRKTIRTYITKHFEADIELTEKIDPSIIGGFILRVEDLQINASIAAQLEKIKRELINS